MIEKTYSQVDIARWNRIVSAAASSGVEIHGYTGQGSTIGVTLEWRYDPIEKQLGIKIWSSWIPISQAESFIDTMIQTA